MALSSVYIPVYGQRHPAALGQSGPVVWSEIWEEIRPLIEPVLDEGRGPADCGRNHRTRLLYFRWPGPGRHALPDLSSPESVRGWSLTTSMRGSWIC